VASIEHRHGREYLSPYSNYAGFEKQPLVCAPGSRILAAASGNRHDLRDGTSFSAPQVTGLLALLMEEFPYYPPEWYIALVKDAARKWDSKGPLQIDQRCGYGIIDAKAAILLGRRRQKNRSTLFLKSFMKSFWRDTFIIQKKDYSQPQALKSNLLQALFQERDGSKVLLPYFEDQLENKILKTQLMPSF
ncbi:MAG: S8 family serine peptidase, partial [Alphaproteobacteria bacterium]|nr:S8 family serine peptidase [Alphaproteobacteria bacterium]